MLDLFSTIENGVNNQYKELNSVVQLSLNDIERQVTETVNDEIMHLADITKNMDKCIDNIIEKSIYRVNLSLNTLDKLNPSRLLLSGYSYATIDGNTINESNTNVGDDVDIVTHNARFKAKITEKEKIC